MSNFLLYQQEGGVVTLTMNSPATRNVLTGNSAPHEFSEACARINTNTSVRVVILTGAGPAFSAGGNLKDMQAMFDLTPAQLREYAKRFGAGPQWQHYTGSSAASVAVQKAFATYRGDKMNHQPVTLLRRTAGQPWVRLEGFVSPSELAGEVKALLGAV